MMQKEDKIKNQNYKDSERKKSPHRRKPQTNSSQATTERDRLATSSAKTAGEKSEAKPSSKKNQLKKKGYDPKFLRRNHNKAEKIIKKKHEVMQCAICGQNIDDPLVAVGLKLNGLAAHFNCILEQLTANHQLAENETIAYIGGGSFAIIEAENSNQSGTKKLVIKQKLDYEQEIKLAVDLWRKDYAITPSLIVAANKTVNKE